MQAEIRLVKWNNKEIKFYSETSPRNEILKFKWNVSEYLPLMWTENSDYKSLSCFITY